MARIAIAIEMEVDDARNIRDTSIVKDKRKESQPSARGRSKRLLLHKGFRDRAAALKAKARVDHLQVTNISRLTANQGRGHVTIAISLDT